MGYVIPDNPIVFCNNEVIFISILVYCISLVHSIRELDPTAI